MATASGSTTRMQKVKAGASIIRKKHPAIWFAITIITDSRMTLVQCLDLQLVLLAIFVISLIVLMEQIAEYFYFNKYKRMKIKIISQRIPRFFNGTRLPGFTDEVKYFIMYKKHWWQKYRYLEDRFTRPMKFDSLDAAEEYLKKNGLESFYKPKE